MKNISSILLILILLNGCISNDKQKNNHFSGLINHMDKQVSKVPEIPVSPVKKENTIQFDPQAKSFNIKDIQFQKFSGDCGVIGTINKVLQYKNRYYIMDQKSESIFIFDSNWVFINKIHKKGRGKGEYLSLDDIAIDKKRNQLVILDVNRRHLIHYSLNGTFIKTIKTPYWMREFAIFPSGNYCFITLGNNYTGYKLFVADSTGKIIKKGINTPEKYHLNMFYRYNSLIKRKQNTVLSIMPMGQTIYKITPDAIYKKYYLDFGEYKFPFSNKKYKDMRSFKKNFVNIHKNQYLSLGIFFNSKQFIGFGLHKTPKDNNKKFPLTNIVYSKKSRDIRVGRFQLLDNMTIPIPKFIEDNYLVSIIQAKKLLKHKQELKKKYNIEGIYDNLTKMSNAVLVYFKIEEF